MRVFFPYFIIYTTSNNLEIEKFAAKLLSVWLIPIPKSDYFIAIISFAPSPTIPTFSLVRPNIFYILDWFCHFRLICYFNYLIMPALDYGVILANIFILSTNGGFKEIKLLSTAIAINWLLKSNLDI